MLKEATYEILDSLASRYIPEGKHPHLHINSREAWVSMMAGLLERGYIRFKMALLVKYAKNWNVVLQTRFSLLN